MTVSSSANRASYSGNGSLTTFAYGFKIFDQDDLTVILRASNGTETVQTITTDYTVTGVGDVSGGNVVFVTAPASGVTVVILREMDLEQGLDLVPNDPFPAQSLENSLDKLTFMVQQHNEELGRTIKASRTNVISGSEFTISAADRANKIFAFDGSGDVNITQAIGVYRGDWAAAVSYAVRDIVKDTSNNNVYIANTAHTSSGTTPLSSNADIAKWDLLVDAASATSSAAAAASSATDAQTAQTAAETAQAAAETAQASAETAETNAETAETNAETAQAAAEAAQVAAELVYDNFDDRYLGDKSTSGGDPTLDNDGDALIDGALFFDTTNNVMKVYNLGTTTWLRTTPTTSDQTNINTVSGIQANVTTVAGISSDVTSVAGISADVTTVAADGTDIGTVAGISANVTTVAGISGNVTTVAGISANVTAVAGDEADIGTVATNISNVNTVAGISGNVTTVAGISADVTSVAGDAADIGTVATNISNVNTVAGVSGNVTTVAGISSDVTSVAGISSDVTSVANNLADVSNFASLYRIAASDPTTSLDEGDLYYNTANDEMKVYNGSAWQAVAPTATSVTVSQVSDLTASAAEINQLDGTADLPDIRPSLLLDFANSKTLDPRITFTRGSTATYWDGKTTAKAEENLYTNSQALNSWNSIGRLDVTADDTTAPDGTTTADKLQQQSGQTTHGYVSQNQTATSGVTYTQSGYFKAGTNRTFVAVLEQISDGTINLTWFNLSSGTVGQTDASHTATITDVGNGWYRCSITYTADANRTASTAFYVSETNGSVTVTDNQGFIYGWGLQFEQRSSATAYTATTSSPIVKYQPVLQTAASGEARFDHDPVTGESKGLLIEEARVNLVTHSVPDLNWGRGDVIFIENAAIAPDGTNTATYLKNNGASEYSSSTQISISSGATVTYSMFLKNIDAAYLRVMFQQAGDFARTWINGSTMEPTGTITYAGSTFSNLSISYENVGNGWYRYSITVDTTGITSHTFFVGTANTDNSFTRDTSKSYLYWGAQVEEGLFPTSYIPTSGSTVTRAVDNAAIIGVTEFNEIVSKAGSTLYFEGDSTSTYGTWGKLVQLGSSSTGSEARLEVFHRPRISSQQVAANFYSASNATLANITMTGALDNTGDIKVAVAFAENDLSGVATGNSLVSDTDAYSVPDYTFDGIGIGGQPSGGSNIVGHIRKIAIYPKRLPNATLQAMTEA